MARKVQGRHGIALSEGTGHLRLEGFPGQGIAVDQDRLSHSPLAQAIGNPSRRAFEMIFFYFAHCIIVQSGFVLLSTPDGSVSIGAIRDGKQGPDRGTRTDPAFQLHAAFVGHDQRGFAPADLDGEEDGLSPIGQ